MNEEFIKYEAFTKSMEQKYPLMLGGQYGGFAIGEGWWNVVDVLMSEIQHHIDWSVKNNQWDLENDKSNIRPVCPQVVVTQIKEKFGGLRFYYDGGDDYIFGLVSMAERWADNTCETCGQKGQRRSGGWVRTLCDAHEEEYKKQKGIE
jgi:hypothetical protein